MAVLLGGDGRLCLPGHGRRNGVLQGTGAHGVLISSLCSISRHSGTHNICLCWALAVLNGSPGMLRVSDTLEVPRSSWP